MWRAKWETSPSGARSQRVEFFTNMFHQLYREATDEKTKASARIWSIMYLSQQPDPETLRAHLKTRLVDKIFRFRSVPAIRNDWMYLDEVDVAAMDWTYHVEVLDQEWADQEAWEKQLNEWNLAPFDADKPFWRFKLVRKMPCGHTGLIFLTEHFVGDGVSMATVTRELVCDGYKGKPVSRQDSTEDPATEALPTRRPNRGLTVAERVRTFFAGTFGPLVELQMPSDGKSLFKLGAGPTGKVKFSLIHKFATSKEPMPLAKFKEIKNKVPGATVNDAFLAVMALGIKRFYEKMNDPLCASKKDMTASFVVNTRPTGADPTSDAFFGNDVVVSSLTYPMHSPRLETLVRFVNQTRMIKASNEFAVRAVMRDYLLNMVPRSQVVQLTADISCKYSISISNVFLSEGKLSIAGVDVVDVLFSTTVPFGLYAGIMTYDQKVTYNATIPESINARPEDLLPFFNSELEALYEEVMRASPKEIDAIDRRVRVGFPFVPLLATAGVLGALWALVYGMPEQLLAAFA